MKKVKFLPCLFFIFLLFPLAAAKEKQKGVFHLSITPSLSFSYGTLYEAVFMDYFTKDYYKAKRAVCYNEYDGCKNGLISLLEWNINGAVTAGLSIDMQYKLLKFSLYGSYTFPIKCGKLFDSDYLNPFNSSIKTMYSASDLAVKSNATIGFDLRPEFNLTKWCSLSPLFTLLYNYYSLKAKDGEGFYGYGNFYLFDENGVNIDSFNGSPYAFDSKYASHYPVGTLLPIDLVRHEIYLYLGIAVRFTPTSFFNIDLSFLTSPIYLILNMDHHYTSSYATKESEKKGYYNDVIYGVFTSFYSNITFNFKINKRNSLGLGLNYHRTLMTRGLAGEASYDKDAFNLVDNEYCQAGAETKLFTLTLSYSFNLL